jgi:ABC-2 type transport system ATP-binding protein
MSILRVDDLTKIFPPRRGFFFQKIGEPFTAVDHISFILKEGEILGFLGPNGAGKTTTMHMLLGILTPTSGSIVYFDKELRTHRSKILAKVGYASAYTKLPQLLTVYENLNVFAQLYGLNSIVRYERIKTCLMAFDAWDLRDRQMVGLSAGQITKVMLAKAFVAEPKVALLDEPTASLDPDIAYEVRHFIREQQKKHGTAILFASHNMPEVTEVCDRVIMLQSGKIIASDTPKKLAATVASLRVDLIIVDGLQRTLAYAREKALRHTVEDRLVKLELNNEAEIATVLAVLAKQGVSYSYISIKKPTLEDYFLQMSGVRRGKKTPKTKG